ncbi:hypothetical protein DL96DRAFT_1602866 [Flagelloscypha sp. PMI_526]|nr:hypothetical protein DL96DRAFT_1602866 [Flagelloscypha sp. PMI_526]
MSPSAPGTFLAFAATVLLIFVCVSPPTWDRISFLDVRQGRGGATRFGVFGYTGSSTQLGYDINDAGFDDVSNNAINNLTTALILYPIAAGLSGIAFVFGLTNARIGTVFMTISSALATVVTLVAWVLGMALWGIVKARLHKQDIDSTWGNANWLGLGAVVALLIGFCASACGIFGRYRKRPAATY